MLWIFGSFLVTPCALTSCHVISNQGSTIRALGYSRYVTGRRSRDENQAVRFGQSAENHSWSRDTQPSRGVSGELARGCKRWRPQAPGRRYGKKKSSLWVYVSPPISHTPHKHQPDYVSAFICITAIQYKNAKLIRLIQTKYLSSLVGWGYWIAMAMKELPIFLKAAMPSMYSIAPADWAGKLFCLY